MDYKLCYHLFFAQYNNKNRQYNQFKDQIIASFPQLLPGKIRFSLAIKVFKIKNQKHEVPNTIHFPPFSNLKAPELIQYRNPVG